MELCVHGARVNLCIGDLIQIFFKPFKIAEKWRDCSDGLLAKKRVKHPRLFRWINILNCSHQIKDCSFSVRLHTLCQLNRTEAETRKSFPLFFRGFVALCHSENKVLDARRGNLGLDTYANNRRTECRNLTRGDAADLTQGADTRHDIRDKRRRCRRRVAEIVDLIGERNNLVPIHLERRAPFRHHIARLIGSDVKSDTHLCGGFGETKKILLCYARLPTGSNDLCNVFGSHRQGSREL